MLTGIIVAVVVVVLLLVLIVGLLIARRRRISLREEAEQEAEAPKPSKGTYAAGGGFSFSAGSGAATKDRPEVGPTSPTIETRSAEPAPAEPSTTEAPSASAPTTEPPATTAPATERPPAEPTPTTDRPSAPTAEPSVEPSVEAPAAEPAPAEPSSTEAPPAPTTQPTAEPSTTEAPAASAPTTEPTIERPPAAPVEAPAAEPAPAEPSTVDAAPAATAPAGPTEPIAPPEGRLERLRGRLGRSRSTLGTGLLGLLGAGDLDEDSWEEVEDQLLMADLGSATTQEVVGKLRERIASRGVRTSEQVRELLHEVLVEALGPDMERSVRALSHDGRPAVVLVVGVNGTGKTTTTGKLARVLVGGGHDIVLGAADTFRAAAAEQLQTWGERAGARVVRGPEGADPASVAFDAVKRGAESGVDAVLLDTAGRLHTKTGLMDELGKVKRVVARQAEVDEVLLVLDATTGQNGLTQARVFGEVVDVTGVVLTKLDGTAKGGIVFQVQRELGVPVKLVGLGEGPDDLAPFEPGAFVDALLR
ncbi:signal recognition particle-docking protein FtsY [Actinomycetospora sp. Odt1-22]|uniref:Signal recognition particle receptor FtsY n=1 Tax=Actinomycetospora termitidis TaxID=3053470 RepID=A0ABT7M5L9_9PSEU|nr:signal recognition particle-docking protein FtsY [Actinomycetospora sp. Odt1-22]MDL5155961.1 signal recognition particle-docking protein FtsY [Actinomycetospora sp. Odt1-22]